jgi:hypothetical protein
VARPCVTTWGVVGAEVVEKTGRRQGKSVACLARGDHGLSWAPASRSLRLFWQELTHEEELPEPAAWTKARHGRASGGLIATLGTLGVG